MLKNRCELFSTHGEGKKCLIISDVNFRRLLLLSFSRSVQEHANKLCSAPVRLLRAPRSFPGSAASRLSLSGLAVCILTRVLHQVSDRAISLSLLRFASVAVAVARTVGGRAGLGRVRCTSRPSVSLSLLPLPSLPCFSRAVHLLRLPFFLPLLFLLLVLPPPYPHPRRLLPLSKSPLASHMDTRGRDATCPYAFAWTCVMPYVYVRACASLLCLLLLLLSFPLYSPREKKIRHDLWAARLSKRRRIPCRECRISVTSV